MLLEDWSICIGENTRGFHSNFALIIEVTLEVEQIIYLTFIDQ